MKENFKEFSSLSISPISYVNITKNRSNRANSQTGWKQANIFDRWATFRSKKVEVGNQSVKGMFTTNNLGNDFIISIWFLLACPLSLTWPFVYSLSDCLIPPVSFLVGPYFSDVAMSWELSNYTLVRSMLLLKIKPKF